ncbi:MAG: 16S rRNA (cytidine(1402)-2'-O)-methyltransferase [Bacteroidales bacterium]|nr:16S rRNA (cytidine(1402)-2'-O)-methyltransferase [Bacteroidales bacterium]
MSKLVVVPTPIGNLEDITLRALRILKTADIILAEDTRTTGFLLKHFEISTKMRSHHKFNEHKTLGATVEMIKQNEITALVSDAGTPGISDPGYLIVKACIENEVEVECLPGATAFVPALINSGFPNDNFCFEGFLPQKKGRQKKLLSLRDESRTIIFYESPHRILKLMEELLLYWGEREVVICRELSKMFEETLRGTVSELIEIIKQKPLKGEIVVVVNNSKD